MATNKVDYVKRTAIMATNHHCHWPGCERKVPPSKWGCTNHWYTLPHELRRAIWQAFEPGQEVSKSPSRAYLAAAAEVQAWILDYQARVDKIKPTLF